MESKVLKKDIFIQEILLMMYSFGDCSKPSKEAALLIRKIVVQQLVSLLNRLDELCVQCGFPVISLKEILFIYRSDYSKLMRIINFLKFKDIKSSAVKYIDSMKEPDNEENDEGPKTPAHKSRLNFCLNFFQAIDPTGHMAELIENESYEDALRKKRDKRLEKVTRGMSGQQYLAFTEARQSSFAPQGNYSKFNDWLFSNMTPPTTTPLDPQLSEILAFLAYEFVGELVERALSIKSEFNQNCSNERGVSEAEVAEVFRRSKVKLLPFDIF